MLGFFLTFLNFFFDSHLSDQACMDSSGHGWNFVTASLPGLSPCDRSSWSWKQWQAPGARSSARRQWHTRTLLFFPTHLLACMFSKIHNINTSYREKQRKNHFNEGFLGYFPKREWLPWGNLGLETGRKKVEGSNPLFLPLPLNRWGLDPKGSFLNFRPCYLGAF